MQTTAGTAHKDIVELEVTILNQQRNRIVPWTRVQAVVNNEPYVEGYSRRLDGPFVRSMLYTRTIPDGSFNLHLSTIQKKINFDRSIPMESRRVPMPGLKAPTIKKVLFASEVPSDPQLVNKGKTMPGVHRKKA